jgi:gamma-butyrobetaine dioxygenase
MTDQPAEVSVGSITERGDFYDVTFEPDGHQAVISKSWLAAALEPEPGARTEDAKRLWAAAGLAGGPPRVGWTSYTADLASKARALDALLTDGFVLLTDVPARPAMVLEVAASMGYVRETNYGKLFDVRSVIDPANLAFTSLAITPHTDNPYRDPVPTVQLLHCLASAAEGGDSGLVDGFAAAGLLREENPAAFAILTSTPVTFRYADATADLSATMPMIGLDPRGRIREVRFNSRSLQPLASRDGSPDAFYRAYRAFAEVLTRPDLMLTFRLEPGDCVAFDNTRVLHARTAFTAGRGPGSRHLQGCYADLDGVASELAVLCRHDKISR